MDEYESEQNAPTNIMLIFFSVGCRPRPAHLARAGRPSRRLHGDGQSAGPAGAREAREAWVAWVAGRTPLAPGERGPGERAGSLAGAPWGREATAR
jgi:hypothetical protein